MRLARTRLDKNKDALSLHKAKGVLAQEMRVIYSIFMILTEVFIFSLYDWENKAGMAFRATPRETIYA